MSLPPRMLALLLGLLLLACGSLAHAGLASYTDKGKTDFDNALVLLNPYGTWSKIGGIWAYTPRDHMAPYTNGQWVYTEYGWYWRGRLPHSWATEHYGYWKRGADKVWSWYPGPYWLPQIVEIRATANYIGWRSAAVDHEGTFIESPDERYAKPDEWTFVSYPQFAGPITPDVPVKPDKVQAILDDTTESRHTYLTYREIDRPGPHPADFITWGKEGGMYPAKDLQDEATPPPLPPNAVIPAPVPANVAAMTGTNAPALMGTEHNPAADKRQVKYWITMSLPTFWTKPPDDAKPGEIYLYRPDFYQDNDGIARRITLWFDPKKRTSLKELLGGSMPSMKSDASSGKTASTNAASTPAIPAEPARSQDPFESPLDETYHARSTSSARASSARASTPSPSTAVPSGLAGDNAPIPSPMINATNKAPVPAR